jgi:hypothetical protein
MVGEAGAGSASFLRPSILPRVFTGAASGALGLRLAAEFQ